MKFLKFFIFQICWKVVCADKSLVCYFPVISHFQVSISLHQFGESLLNPYLNFCISFCLNLYIDSHKSVFLLIYI